MRGDDQSRDDVFSVLAHRHRRDTLAVLTEHETSLTLLDLANEIARREHGGPVDDISEETITTVYVNLYHRHIPKLAEAGFVEYDRGTDFVELIESAKSVLSDLPEDTVGEEVRQR